MLFEGLDVHTFFQLTGFSGSFGPKDTTVLEATWRKREYDGLSYRC